MSDLVTAMRGAFARVAADSCARFAGDRNGYLDGSASVHAVRTQAWFGGLEVPAPSCHVGIGTWDITRFRPTTAAVNCGRCLRAGASPDPTADHPDQTQLDLEVTHRS